MPSATHAGGIQPSSSFFRPARPEQQPQYSPDPSISEQVDDLYPSSSGHDPDVPLKAVKHSREPLLPIGGPSSSPRRTTSTRVRNSVDRVFDLSFSHTSRLPEEERAEPSPHSHSHSFTKPPDSPIRFFHSSQPLARSLRSRSRSPSRVSSPSPTPPPSFIASPPQPSSAQPYLPSRTPILRPGTSTPYRKHHLHPSRNRFFLRGRLLTGGDSPWAFIASFSLAIFLCALWCSTTCVFWWHHANATKAVVIIGAYLAALVLSTMLATATTDPGILPRNLDLDPPYPATSPSDGGVRAPLPRDLRVRSQVCVSSFMTPSSILTTLCEVSESSIVALARSIGRPVRVIAKW